MPLDDDDGETACDVERAAAEWIAVARATLERDLAADPDFTPDEVRRLLRRARPIVAAFYRGWFACALDVSGGAVPSPPSPLSTLLH
jgi:hypothetical protein